MTRIGFQWLIAASVLALTACDGGPSAVAKRDGAAPAGGYSGSNAERADTRYDDGGSSRSKAEAPAKLAADGRPVWAASRRGSAEQQAQKAFARNGQAFGADSVEAYVQKVHAFTANPPKGSQTITRRNGDRLIYDPRGNVFAVVTKDGAPRTMFKPDDGAAYWEKVKANEAKPRRASKKDADDQA